ncbi:MAG: GGDEF domain-containing protein [Vicinamibacterales bacterium]
MVDIDHFKHVNDTHGHAVGDDVLRAVADTLAAGVRGFDRVFRVGGEEFAVLLEGTEGSAAATTAERLRAAVEHRPVSIDGQALAITISVGAALGAGTTTSGRLTDAADAALYRAKANGRNRVEADDLRR